MSIMDGPASPDEDNITIVTQRCQCDKERAINLLSVAVPLIFHDSSRLADVLIAH